MSILKKYAGQDVNRKTAAAYVMVDCAASKREVGFYKLCTTSVERSSFPTELTKRLPRYPEIPAILVGRLASDTGFPGSGALFPSDAITRCVRGANEIAAS